MVHTEKLGTHTEVSGWFHLNNRARISYIKARIIIEHNNYINSNRLSRPFFKHQINTAKRLTKTSNDANWGGRLFPILWRSILSLRRWHSSLISSIEPYISSTFISMLPQFEFELGIHFDATSSIQIRRPQPLCPYNKMHHNIHKECCSQKITLKGDVESLAYIQIWTFPKFAPRVGCCTWSFWNHRPISTWALWSLF